MPVLSAVENVELPLLVAGMSSKEARRKALGALELVACATGPSTSRTSSPAGSASA